VSASSDVLTASDNSMGNSGGTTEVRISVHSKNNLYRLRFGFSVPEQKNKGVSQFNVFIQKEIQCASHCNLKILQNKWYFHLKQTNFKTNSEQ
jgi:hypothetical protein